LIGAKGVAHFVLHGEARISSLVERYTADVEAGHDPLARGNPAGRELYDILISPTRALIPAGAAVIVVPDGSLHGLNFETLIAADPAPHYWIEDVTVSVAPALGLRNPRPRGEPVRPGCCSSAMETEGGLADLEKRMRECWNSRPVHGLVCRS